MKPFQELGAGIEDLWRERNYDEEIFPELAERALREADLPSRVPAWEVIEWTLGETTLPVQRDLAAKFGDPPITLYNAPRFHVDVYFWLEGTTTVHQHAFCGAFQVLHGSSIHSWYDFEDAERINVFTEAGRMRLRSCDLLGVGDIQKILAGRSYIHSLFHLDQPSATIVVRTHSSPMHLPQYNYHKPGLAIDPFFEDPGTIKKLQAVTALIRADHPETDRLIAGLLEEADLQTSFQIIATARTYFRRDQVREMFDPSGSKQRLEELFAVVDRRHGERAALLRKVFGHHDRLDRIVELRASVKDPEHRFFLALLLNVEGRDRIFELIATRYPDEEPLDKVLDWTDALARTRVMGSGVPNALGVENFDDFDLLVLEHLLEGRDDEATLEAMRADMPGQDPEALTANIGERLRKIRSAVIFQPLLS